MDDQGRLIIPGELRKDGKPFVGKTFEETKAFDESPVAKELNDQEHHAKAEIKRKIAEIEAELRNSVKA